MPEQKYFTQPEKLKIHNQGCRPCVWKTTEISPIGAHSKVRLSVLLNELNRIQNRPRMHLGYVPTENFLNSRPLVEFDDETKYIRAQADKLMRYIYVPVPHQTTKPLITSYERITSNGLYPYSRSGIKNNIVNMSYYTEPTRTTIGRGHLACVTFAGGRGYPRRKHLFSDEYRDIGDEIKVRSYYNKNLLQSNRLDDALTLPTGFAARLLTTERRPYAADDKKSSITKYKKNEPKTPGEILFTQKREKLGKKDELMDIELLKTYQDAPKKDDEFKTFQKQDIQDVNTDSKKNQEIFVEKAVSPVSVESRQTEEKPKVKKETKRRLSEKSAEESLDVKSTTGGTPKKQETVETNENECIPVNTKIIPETPKKLLKKKSKDLTDTEEIKKVLKQPSIDEVKVLEDKSQEIETQPEAFKKLEKTKHHELPPKEEEQFKIPEPASEEKELIPESTTEIKKTPEHFDETLKSVEETKPVESEPVQEAIIEPESPAVLPETLETNVELESTESPNVQKIDAEIIQPDVVAETTDDLKITEEVKISEFDDEKNVIATATEFTASEESEITNETEVKSSEVTASKESEVTASDEPEVTASKESEVTASKETEVTASKESEVTASNESEITASKESEVTAIELSNEPEIDNTEIADCNQKATTHTETTLIQTTQITSSGDEEGPVIITETARKQTTVIQSSTEITVSEQPGTLIRKETVISTEITSTDENADPVIITEITENAEPIIEEPVTPEANTEVMLS